MFPSRKSKTLVVSTRKISRTRSVSTIAAALLLSTMLASCSSSSDGSADGDGTAGLSDQDLALQNEKRFGDGSIPGAQADGLFKDVHFEFNSSVVPTEFHEQLRKTADNLRGDPTLKAEIEGHCDKRGTSEYNLALGEERSKSVAKMLVSFGVPSSQLSTVSYGEEIPLDPRDAEDAYAQNRRAHFAVFRNQGSNS